MAFYTEAPSGFADMSLSMSTSIDVGVKKEPKVAKKVAAPLLVGHSGTRGLARNGTHTRSSEMLGRGLSEGTGVRRGSSSIGGNGLSRARSTGLLGQRQSSTKLLGQRTPQAGSLEFVSKETNLLKPVPPPDSNFSPMQLRKPPPNHRSLREFLPASASTSLKSGNNNTSLRARTPSRENNAPAQPSREPLGNNRPTNLSRRSSAASSSGTAGRDALVRYRAAREAQNRGSGFASSIGQRRVVSSGYGPPSRKPSAPASTALKVQQQRHKQLITKAQNVNNSVNGGKDVLNSFQASVSLVSQSFLRHEDASRQETSFAEMPSSEPPKQLVKEENPSKGAASAAKRLVHQNLFEEVIVRNEPYGKLLLRIKEVYEKEMDRPERDGDFVTESELLRCEELVESATLENNAKKRELRELEEEFKNELELLNSTQRRFQACLDVLGSSCSKQAPSSVEEAPNFQEAIISVPVQRKPTSLSPGSQSKSLSSNPDLGSDDKVKGAPLPFCEGGAMSPLMGSPVRDDITETPTFAPPKRVMGETPSTKNIQ